MNLKIGIHISVGKSSKCVYGFCISVVHNGDNRNSGARALVSRRRAQLATMARWTWIVCFYNLVEELLEVTRRCTQLYVCNFVLFVVLLQPLQFVRLISVILY